MALSSASAAPAQPGHSLSGIQVTIKTFSLETHFISFPRENHDIFLYCFASVFSLEAVCLK